MTNQGHQRPGEQPTIEERVQWGKVFSARAYQADVADGNTLSLVITNPADSGVNLLTVAPSFSAQSGAFIQKIQNPTIDAAGSSVQILNKDIGNTRDSLAEAETGGTYSGGTSRGTEVIGSQSGGGGGGTVGSVDLSLRIPEGNSVQYQMESDSAGNDMSVAINFIEESI